MADFILDILRPRVGDKLRHISSAKGGEWCSPCPVCGGTDRFRCWPSQPGGETTSKAGVSGTWWCRQCDKTGDVIGLLMFMDGLTFKAACKELRIELSESGRRRRPLHAPKQPDSAGQWIPQEWPLPSEQWRAQATKMASEAHAALLEYPRALAFLERRGITLEAVRRYTLGYLHGEDKKTGACLYRARSAFGLPDKLNSDGTKTRYQSLWIPRGFTIPLWSPSWNAQEEVHRIRIRRPKGDLKKKDDSKYMLLTGSGQAPMCLAPVDRNPSLTVWVVVEAELDAMAVHHACAGNVGALAILTNRGKPDAAAHKLLTASPLILVALDFDPPDDKGRRPGYQGWEWWQAQYPQAKRWPVPVGKDPGEAFQEGISLSDWVRAGLPRSLDFGRAGSVRTTLGGQCLQGEGGRQTTQPSCEHQKHDSPCRWRGAEAEMPLSEAMLPEGCPETVQRLRRYYAGKSSDAGVLLPCPKTQPPWYWIYQKHCRTCRGHAHCLFDFLMSPQMFAPLETFAHALESTNVELVS